MFRIYQADLHIHSCLSPCADLEMSPSAIVKKALEKRLEIIGLTDHNSCENAQSVMRAARGEGLTVLPGMEITTAEEVHILVLFDEQGSFEEMQEYVYKNLFGKNDTRLFGLQPIVNEFGDVLAFSDRLLIGATALSLKDAVKSARNLGALVIASHVDRQSFSIIGQLGFIPGDIALDGLEITDRNNFRCISSQYPEYSIVLSSDAHRLNEIGKTCTLMKLNNPTFTEIKNAFRNRKGRKILLPE